MKKTLIALMLVLALVLGLFPCIAEDGVKEVTLTMAGAKHTPSRVIFNIFNYTFFALCVLMCVFPLWYDTHFSGIQVLRTAE